MSGYNASGGPDRAGVGLERRRWEGLGGGGMSGYNASGGPDGIAAFGGPDGTMIGFATAA